MRAPSPSVQPGLEPDGSHTDDSRREDPTPPAALRVRSPSGSAPPTSRPIGTPPLAMHAAPAPMEAPPLQAMHAKPTPAAMRARARVADDVIESGEIVERRSLVIRSQPVPVLDWNDEKTELTARPLPAPRHHSRPGASVPLRVLALAGALVFGIAGIVLAVRNRPDAANIEALQSRAEALGSTLDADARAAMVRAEAIATSPVLRAAIETDASTIADMARDRDVAFPLEKGDVIEVYQVRAGARTLMLRLPTGAAQLAPPKPGQTMIDGAGDRLAVVANAVVTNQRADITGEIVLSTPVALADLTKHVKLHTTGAHLVGTREPVTLVASKSAPNVTIPIQAKTASHGALALAAVVPMPGGSSLWAWLCMSIAAALLAVFAIAFLRARRESLVIARR